MIRELIPVVMRFNNIAANSNINFTFTTAGASWCLGARSGDAMGFSLQADEADGQVQSMVQKIEFNDHMLALQTGSTSSASLGSFSLTLFLHVADGVDYLQGYCTLNNEANVMVYFGAQQAVDWRNGRISAVLNNPESQYRSVMVSVFGAQAGDNIQLELSTKQGLGMAHWCLGPVFSGAGGILLGSADGSVPLSSFSYNHQQLSFSIASQGQNADSMDFLLRAFICWEPQELPYIYLKATCDNHISLIAHVGNRQPQLVSQALTVFTL